MSIGKARCQILDVTCQGSAALTLALFAGGFTVRPPARWTRPSVAGESVIHLVVL